MRFLFLSLLLISWAHAQGSLRGCPRNASNGQALVYTPAAEGQTGSCQWTSVPDLTDWLDGFSDAVNTSLMLSPDAANQVVSDRGGVSQRLFMSLLQQRYQQRLQGQLKEIDLIDACLQGSVPSDSSLSASEFTALSSRCPALIGALTDKAAALGPRMVDLAIQNSLLDHRGDYPLAVSGGGYGCIYTVEQACANPRVQTADPEILEDHRRACRVVHERNCEPSKLTSILGNITHQYSGADVSATLTPESLARNLRDINHRMVQERPLNPTAGSYLGEVSYDREEIAPRLRQQNQREYDQLFLSMPLVSHLSNFNSPLSDAGARGEWTKGLDTLRRGVRNLMAQRPNPTQLGALSDDIQSVIDSNPQLCAEAYALMDYSHNQEGWRDAIQSTVDVGSTLGCLAFGWTGVGAISCASAGLALTAVDLADAAMASSRAHSEVFSSVEPIDPAALDRLINAQADFHNTLLLAPLALADVGQLTRAARSIAGISRLQGNELARALEDAVRQTPLEDIPVHPVRQNIHFTPDYTSDHLPEIARIQYADLVETQTLQTREEILRAAEGAQRRLRQLQANTRPGSFQELSAIDKLRRLDSIEIAWRAENPGVRLPDAYLELRSELESTLNLTTPRPGNSVGPRPDASATYPSGYLERYTIPPKVPGPFREIVWPPGNGFAGAPRGTHLEVGTLVDRFGGEGGSFFAPAGTTYERRSLAAYSATQPYYVYRVRKPLPARAGEIAPWFGMSGGGIQYQTTLSAEELVELGYLERVSVTPPLSP